MIPPIVYAFDTIQKVSCDIFIIKILACWACSYVDIPKEQDVSTEDAIIVPAVRVDEIVKENVLLMKIDVEGFEVNALLSAKVFFFLLR